MHAASFQYTDIFTILPVAMQLIILGLHKSKHALHLLTSFRNIEDYSFFDKVVCSFELFYKLLTLEIISWTFHCSFFFLAMAEAEQRWLYLLHIIRTVQFLPSLCILPLLARLFVVINILCFIKLALCCQLINPLCHLLSVFLWCSSANSASGIRDELLPELWSMWFSIFIESLDCLSRRSNCFNSFAKPDDF